MKKNEKLEKISETFKSVYDGKISKAKINAFAEDLYDSLFVCQNELDDIFAIINEYECDANVEDSECVYVFTCMIDLLDNNKVTAKRLYNSFMNGFQLLDTFVKLVNENAEYISTEKLAAAKETAYSLFDHQFLEIYGITG